MINFDELLQLSPFSIKQTDKDSIYIKHLKALTEFHKNNCLEYGKIIDGIFGTKDILTPEDTPFIPVRLFKELDLKSIPDSEVFKVLTSSGTSGQRVSKIYVDKSVTEKQRKVLSKLTTDFIGPKRLPMLIIDSKSTLRDPRSFSARGAGILGFSMFGKNTTYALDENMNLDIKTINSFLDKHANSPILLFGFTSIIWQHFTEEIKRRDYKIDIDKGILIHGGGWKKLADKKITNNDFKSALKETANIKKVYNYYGMIEPTGSIFFECEEGHLHTSIFSDIIIRNDEFKALTPKKRGLIQLLSLIPTSYPGHSILSEDEGEILGVDDCSCGRLGKYFKIYGRVKNAEIRGCSDTIK